MASLTKDDIAAVQQEIQRAGRRAYRAGLRSIAALAVAVCALTVVNYVLFPPNLGDVPLWAALLFSLAGAALFGIFLGGSVAERLAHAYRKRLQRELEMLSPPQRLAILLPLKNARAGETSVIVEPLVRELQRAGELAPAAAPDGRGDEPAAAQRR